jgi:hypothetical protein
VGHTLLPNSIMGKAHELKKQVGKTAANYLESDSPSLTCYMFKKQLQVKACGALSRASDQCQCWHSIHVTSTAPAVIRGCGRGSLIN